MRGQCAKQRRESAERVRKEKKQEKCAEMSSEVSDDDLKRWISIRSWRFDKIEKLDQKHLSNALFLAHEIEKEVKRGDASQQMEWDYRLSKLQSTPRLKCKDLLKARKLVIFYILSNPQWLTREGVSLILSLLGRWGGGGTWDWAVGGGIRGVLKRAREMGAERFEKIRRIILWFARRFPQCLETVAQALVFSKEESAEVGEYYTVLVNNDRFGVVWDKLTHVVSVKPNTPAQEAGILPGSTIKSIGNDDIAPRTPFKQWLKIWKKHKKFLPFSITLLHPPPPFLDQKGVPPENNGGVPGRGRWGTDARVIDRALMHIIRASDQNVLFSTQPELVACVVARCESLAVQYISYIEERINKELKALQLNRQLTSELQYRLSQFMRNYRSYEEIRSRWKSGGRKKRHRVPLDSPNVPKNAEFISGLELFGQEKQNMSSGLVIHQRFDDLYKELAKRARIHGKN
ncbi:hypothetical protein AAMO2058_000393300 [Amorphochlora amoebiformis]